MLTLMGCCKDTTLFVTNKLFNKKNNERQANSRHHRPRPTAGGAGHALRHSPQGGRHRQESLSAELPRWRVHQRRAAPLEEDTAAGGGFALQAADLGHRQPDAQHRCRGHARRGDGNQPQALCPHTQRGRQHRHHAQDAPLCLAHGVFAGQSEEGRENAKRTAADGAGVACVGPDAQDGHTHPAPSVHRPEPRTQR